MRHKKHTYTFNYIEYSDISCKYGMLRAFYPWEIDFDDYDEVIKLFEDEKRKYTDNYKKALLNGYKTLMGIEIIDYIYNPRSKCYEEAGPIKQFNINLYIKELLNNKEESA